MALSRIILKPKRDRPIRQHHPWVFSGSITRVEGSAQDGDLVDVFSASNEWLARGYLNRRSQITVRLFSWDREQLVDQDFWRSRLEQALVGRSGLDANPKVTAYRIVNAESDGIPGLVVDRYDDWLVIQALTLGIEERKHELAGLLFDLVPGVKGVYERSDVDVREKEGMLPAVGSLVGEEPPDLIEIVEHGYQFLVDVKGGHKTGFYLDQRRNRALLPSYCNGAEVLNAFAYTGAFGIYALGGGAAEVTNVDTLDQALALAMQHVEINRFDVSNIVNEVADVFAQLRAFRAANRQFDVIILDPPRFATSQRSVRKASRGYKDINWIAFQLLKPGGILFTFSCSGLVSRDLFQKIVFGAALDAERDVQIIGQLSQSSDHPVALYFPEAAYLKGFICRCW